MAANTLKLTQSNLSFMQHSLILVPWWWFIVDWNV